MTVAVVAHADKTLGGGLPELRRALQAAGVEEPLWYEVPKAKKASEQAERAWRGGRSWCSPGAATERCGAASTCSAGTEASLAIIPAGTANLFATNLGIPERHRAGGRDRPSGDRRKLDVGTLRRRALRGHGGGRL